MQEIIMENADQEMLFSDGVVVAFRDSDPNIILLGIRCLKSRRRGAFPLIGKIASSLLDSSYQVTNHG
jgi:hypothetical protein